MQEGPNICHNLKLLNFGTVFWVEMHRPLMLYSRGRAALHWQVDFFSIFVGSMAVNELSCSSDKTMI